MRAAACSNSVRRRKPSSTFSARSGARSGAARRRRGGALPARLLDALAGFETDLASGRVEAEILAQRDRLLAAQIRVLPYRPEWAPHFERINLEWLERWFAVEAVDREMLARPQQHVLDPGGAIVFAELDGEIVGTCALLKEAPGV